MSFNIVCLLGHCVTTLLLPFVTYGNFQVCLSACLAGPMWLYHCHVLQLWGTKWNPVHQLVMLKVEAKETVHNYIWHTKSLTTYDLHYGSIKDISLSTKTTLSLSEHVRNGKSWNSSYCISIILSNIVHIHNVLLLHQKFDIYLDKWQSSRSSWCAPNSNHSNNVAHT